LIRLSRALREKRPEYKQRHDKVILHDNARSHIAKNIFGNAQMGCFYGALAVFSGHCSFGLLIVPKDGRKQQVTNSLLSQKSKIGSPPKTIIFSRWNSKIAREMGKSSRQQWTIF